MSMNSEAGKLIRGTVEAHTTLVLFETISTMLESSDIKGDRARAVARKAVTLLRREQQLLLSDFDRASLSAKRAMEFPSVPALTPAKQAEARPHD